MSVPMLLIKTFRMDIEPWGGDVQIACTAGGPEVSDEPAAFGLLSVTPARRQAHWETLEVGA